MVLMGFSGRFLVRQESVEWCLLLKQILVKEGGNFSSRVFSGLLLTQSHFSPFKLTQRRGGNLS